MKSKHLLSGISAFALLTAASHAVVLVESATFTNVPLASPAFDLTLNKFNGALGTLVSVEFKLEVTTQGSSLTFDNEATVGGSVTLNLGAEVKAKTGIALITEVMVNPMKTGMGTVLADNDPFPPDFMGTDSFTISSGVLSDSASILRTTAPYLAQFTAMGVPHTFLTTISNKRDDSFTTSGIFGETSAQGGTFSGKLSVIYNYNALPIPEPGSAIWGLAIGLFGGFRRVRARRS